MLIKAGDRLIPMSAIESCVIKGDEIVINTISGKIFMASGKEAEVIRAMVARVQKPSSIKKESNVRQEEEVG